MPAKGTDLQVGTLDTYLRRLFNLKADAVVPSIAGELGLQVDAFDVADADRRAPRGETLGSAFSTGIAAVVGQTPTAILFNPVGSQRLVTVVSAALALGTTNDLLTAFLVDSTGALGLGGFATTRDTRVRGSGAAPRLTAQMFQGTVAAIPGTLGTLRLDMQFCGAAINHEDTILRRPVVLSPGFGYMIAKTSTAGNLQVGFASNGQGFEWIERDMEASEAGPF